MTALAAPPVTQLALSLDVIVDVPTTRERLDLLRELRGIHLGDVWTSGEYRIERDEIGDVDTVRFLRGAHVRGEWGVTSENRLAAALRLIHAELVGTGITTGWLRPGLLYAGAVLEQESDDCPSEWAYNGVDCDAQQEALVVVPLQIEAENWRDIPGFEGRYQISDCGGIRSVDRVDSRGCHWRGRLLKPFVGRTGYYHYPLRNNGRVRDYRIHSLVALVFLGERPPRADVNHRDGNKLNNHVSNLEYCTRGQNLAHAHANDLRPSIAGDRNGRAKLTEIEVRNIKMYLTNGFGRRFLSERYQVSRASIDRIANGVTWVNV